MGYHLARSGTEAGSGSKDCGTCHAIAAGNDERGAGIAFVPEVATRTEQRADEALVHNFVFGVCLLYAFGAETDVEHTEAAQIALVLRKEERQLHLL